MKLYSVVNMDIVGSRNIIDRDKLQLNLYNYIEHINEKYISILSAPITITLGDEWQLITYKPSEAYNLIHEFQQLLWANGLEIYAGIGIGELSTPISDDIRKMDGPCFHIAREAINIAKSVDKLKNRYSINKLNKVFLLICPMYEEGLGFSILDFFYTSKIKNMDPAMQEIAAATERTGCNSNNVLLNKLILERTINLIIENNEVLKAKMTDKQKAVYINYSRLGSYRKVTDAVDGSAKETIGGISQKLNNASYFTIQRNHNMVSTLLNMYCSMEE